MRTGPAFLIAQIGAHAASKFAERLVPLDLTPADAGILRILGMRQDLPQAALAERLGMFPSRLVLVLDDLERRRLITRETNPEDRRANILRLTETGAKLLGAVARVAHAHEQALLAGLSQEQRAELLQLLSSISEEQGLTPGVHPGYRALAERQAATPDHDS